MKKALVILVLVASLALLSGFTAKQPRAHILTVSGAVTAIDSEYVHIETDDGNGYVLYFSERFLVGDSVRLTFDTKGNSDLYDDELIELALLLPVE